MQAVDSPTSPDDKQCSQPDVRIFKVTGTVLQHQVLHVMGIRSSHAASKLVVAAVSRMSPANMAHHASGYDAS